MDLTIDESVEKMIERMENCDKIPVDYMDLLSHRVRCRKIEIFHYDDKVSFTPDDAEEEQELSLDQLMSDDRTDDEDRTMKLVGDLDCLIRRIEQMQLAIKRRKDFVRQMDTSGATSEQVSSSGTPMPELGVFQFKECMPVRAKKELRPYQEQLATNEVALNEPYRTVLSAEEELEVRNLQHAHHQLQCEIDELICNYRCMRTLLSTMRREMCNENRRVRKLGEMTQSYKEWSQKVAKELPVCKQRYSCMLEKKLSKEEAKHIIAANSAKAAKYTKTYLTKRQLNYELREFNLEIKELQEYTSDLHNEMTRRFIRFEKEANGKCGKFCAKIF
ncbi:uncharacterized protein LOC111594169 [Drosophila hydei]|uniref:Uncharacterized protein LOC111594169 n=1 Tax=Drosophila hydei TaxID=7224 RepID=A0A6J1LIF9_DROHY|nr:uncharacterized protein LOC111594169 [Drosophila hydei]